jgi:hypothetical protein
MEQAIVLEKNYKEMLHQGDEVDLRIKLWRDATEICKSNSKSKSLNPLSKTSPFIYVSPQFAMSGLACARSARYSIFLTSSPLVVCRIFIHLHT